MQVGHGIDHGEAESPAGVAMGAHRRGKRAADDLAAAPLHHEERRAEHGGIVAEEIGAGRPVEPLPEAREHLVLALHVVGARGELAHGRPPQHQLARAHAQEVREVGVTVRELLDGSTGE